jgi:hypothetical protein
MIFFADTLLTISKLVPIPALEIEKIKHQRNKTVASLDCNLFLMFVFWNPSIGFYNDVKVGVNKISFSAEIGYVGLFPLLLGILPEDSVHLPILLEKIRDPNHLWTE